jgi:3-oxoacyl-[acyl-carrier protein] reductase
VGTRLPLAGARAESPGRRGPPRDAGAPLGADPQRRLSSTIEPIHHLNLSYTHRLAAVGYLKTLAREVAADGITVNTIATGRFATERIAAGAGGSLETAEEAARTEIPAARLGRPEEYGDLAAFLCSPRAAYITGTVIPIDGGLPHSI